MFADQVAFHQRNGQLIAISYSIGNGAACWVGRDGSDPATYDQWPSLWHVLGMAPDINFENPSEADWERLGEWVEQAPEGLDENLDLIAAKLAELPAS